MRVFTRRNIAIWLCVATAAPLPAQEVASALACADSLHTTPELPQAVVTAGAPGPTVAVVSGVHGGKAAAVRAVTLLAERLPGQLRRGRVLLVAPANAAGFRAGLAQLSPVDSLNLNRVFPGDPCGSHTERVADRMMRDIVAQSDYLLDLHGSDGLEAVGRFAYAARPGLEPAVDSVARQLAEWWGVPTIVWDREGPRTLATSRFLQTAAHLSGVPAITVFEAGDTSVDPAATRAFLHGAARVLTALGMLDSATAVSDGPPPTDAADALGAAGASAAKAEPMVLPRRLVHLAQGEAAWRPVVRPGQRVADGELLGRVEGSSGEVGEVRAAGAGIVLHLRRLGTVNSGTVLAILGDRGAAAIH